MKLIPLSQNSKNPNVRGKYFAMVDDEDYDFLMQWKWNAEIGGSTVYAVRNDTTVGLNGGKRKRIRMHRLIMNLSSLDLVVDHINHDGLDNRKVNLRITTERNNCFNQRKIPNKSSKYKGVSFKQMIRHYTRKTDGNITTSKYSHYTATITKEGAVNYLGAFHSEIDAARAYDEKAKELFGEFAVLNFP